jgi:hypothetical protein
VHPEIHSRILHALLHPRPGLPHARHWPSATEGRRTKLNAHPCRRRFRPPRSILGMVQRSGWHRRHFKQVRGS